MSEFNPSIVIIEKVEKHPNADKLDIATVLGDYPVIIGRDTYKVGDIATYICVDTVLSDIEEYHFLTPKAFEQYEVEDQTGKMVIKNRPIGYKYSVGSVPESCRVIKAKKILGIFSMGIILPAVAGLVVGDSVVEALQLKKWEEENEENFEPGKKKKMGANAEKAPTTFVSPYYDIEGLRKYGSAFLPGEEVVLHEKLEGSNASFCYDGERLWSKSRNWFKRFDPECVWWDAAIRMDLETKLKKYPLLVFFGELIGQVKGFRYDATVVDGSLKTLVRFFDILDSRTMRYLDYEDFKRITDDLELPTAPLLYKGPWLEKEEMYKFAEGKSTLNDKHLREGFVAKPVVNRYEPKLGGRIILKFVGMGYSLQK